MLKGAQLIFLTCNEGMVNPQAQDALTRWDKNEAVVTMT